MNKKQYLFIIIFLVSIFGLKNISQNPIKKNKGQPIENLPPQASVKYEVKKYKKLKAPPSFRVTTDLTRVSDKYFDFKEKIVKFRKLSVEQLNSIEQEVTEEISKSKLIELANLGTISGVQTRRLRDLLISSDAIQSVQAERLIESE